MESYEVLKNAVDRVGVKEAASALNVSTSLVYKWCEQPRTDDAGDASGARNPLDRIQALIKCAGSNDLVSWLCEQNNGFFVSNPEVRHKTVDNEFISHTRRMIQDFSELLNVMSESISDDNAIDKQESKKIRQEWESLKQLSEEFVCACEKGLFL